MKLACAKNTQSASWTNIETDFQGLVEHLQSNIVKTAETRQEYLALEKLERAKLKNVGGVMAGFLTNNTGRRKLTEIGGADMLAYDADTAAPDLISHLRKSGYTFVAHTTRSHTLDNPRWRVFFPLSRTVNAAEWQHCMRVVAQTFGTENFCGCSYRINQVMYYGSHSVDQPATVFNVVVGKSIDVDATLTQPYDKTLFSLRGENTRHENPCDRDDTSGAFNRLYTPQEAMEQWLGDIYAPTGDPDRWRYLKGHGEAGVIIYQDGLVYSNQSDDPAANGHCNSAFDLLKIHMFDGDFGATCQWIEDKMPEVVTEKARKAFAVDGEVLPAPAPAVTADWKMFMPDQKKNKTTGMPVEGAPIQSTANNCYFILEHDEHLKGIIYNMQSHRLITKTALPWDKVDRETEDFNKHDWALLSVYLSLNYATFDDKVIEKAVEHLCSFRAQRIHPLRDYLNSLKWDGVKRVDTLFIDHLCVADTELNRAMTRKWIAAAIQRAFEPGIKFDTALIIAGSTGIGKSTMFQMLGLQHLKIGAYSDSVKISEMKSVKTVGEKLSGLWIAELNELDGMYATRAETLKSFLSSSEDLFREPWGRTAVFQPRMTVFAGTTNKYDFLIDETGNRRFWVLRCIGGRKKLIDRATVDQVWAEAMATLRDEQIWFDKADEDKLEAARKEFLHIDARYDSVVECIQRMPVKWVTAHDVWQRMNGDRGQGNFPAVEQSAFNKMLYQISGGPQRSHKANGRVRSAYDCSSVGDFIEKTAGNPGNPRVTP